MFICVTFGFPMMGARSFFVCSGTNAARVMMAVASASLRARARRVDALDGLRDRLLRGHGVLQQVRDDEVDRHRVVVGMPAVVVGDQRERRVADLRLARELRFLQVRHADDVHPHDRYSFDSASVENCGPSMFT